LHSAPESRIVAAKGEEADTSQPHLNCTRYDPAALGKAMNLRGDAENGPAARSLVELNGSFALLDMATDGVQRDTAR
jgi:hypothetical protein